MLKLIQSLVLVTMIFYHNFLLSAHEEILQESETFIMNIAQETFMLANELTDAELEDKMLKMADANINYNWMAKFALGKHWRKLDTQQQQKYLSAYRQNLINKFLPILSQYQGERFVVNKVKKSARGDVIVLVDLYINKTSQPLSIGYIVKKNQNYINGFYIKNIMIEGISIISTMRTEYNSFIQTHGLASFIEKM